MKVLLATDKNLRPVLEDKGFICVEASDDIVEDLRFGAFDMVVLEDSVIPAAPAVRVIRRAGLDVPIFMLTRSRAIATRVEALNLGADEVQQAPMDDEEFVARVLAVLRRDRSQGEDTTAVGSLVVDFRHQRVELAGVPVHLTVREFSVIEALARRPGSVITTTMFLDHAYGGRDEPCQKIYDVLVCKIRKKFFEASRGRDWIENVWGRGYRLVPEYQCKPPQTRGLSYRL